MVQKRKIKKFKEFSSKELCSATIILCSEKSVRCRHLPLFRKYARKKRQVFVAMPAVELKEGSCGLAKAQIIASIKGIKRIITCNQEDLKRIQKGEFGAVKQIGNLSIQDSRHISFNKAAAKDKIKISRTSMLVDRKFMEQALKLVPKSTCWWRPTACVVVRDNRIIMRAVSLNPWKTDCKKLIVKPTDISLSANERISFCDAIHAEKVAIAQAAKEGIPLRRVAFYITVCPCEECAKAFIQAGVKKVVFDSEYYDRDGLFLLRKNGVKIVKIKNG